MSEYCEQHIMVATDLSSIKTSVVNIEKQLTEGINFKTAVISSLVGIIILIVIQVVTFSYFYGQLSNQVLVNTARLAVLENAVK